MNVIKKGRVFHKSKSFAEAEEWDILQNIRMTYEQRQKSAYELRKRVYGIEVADVRETRVGKKIIKS